MAAAFRMVLDAVTPRLIELGFKKRAAGIFTIELVPDVLGWLGLNRAMQHRPPGEVEINPVVGVRFQGIERLVAELRGEKFHPYQPPTLSTPLGYVLPDSRYRAWISTPDRAADAAKDMVAAIAAYGLPFMRSKAELGELCQALEARYGFEHQLMYRRPVACFLEGNLARARALLDESGAALGDRSDLAATEFRRFAEALRGRLSSA